MRRRALQFLNYRYYILNNKFSLKPETSRPVRRYVTTRLPTCDVFLSLTVVMNSMNIISKQVSEQSDRSRCRRHAAARRDIRGGGAGGGGGAASDARGAGHSARAASEPSSQARLLLRLPSPNWTLT